MACAVLAEANLVSGLYAIMVGTPETHEVSDEAGEQAEVAVESQPEEPAAE